MLPLREAFVELATKIEIEGSSKVPEYIQKRFYFVYMP